MTKRIPLIVYLALARKMDRSSKHSPCSGRFGVLFGSGCQDRTECRFQVKYRPTENFEVDGCFEIESLLVRVLIFLNTHVIQPPEITSNSIGTMFALKDRKSKPAFFLFKLNMLDIVQKVLCFLVLMGCLFISAEQISLVTYSPRQEEASNSLVLSSDIDTSWRHTSEGWQNSEHWCSGDTFVPVSYAASIHPLVWTVMVLFLVVTILIWASSEEEVARLLGDDDRGAVLKKESDAGGVH